MGENTAMSDSGHGDHGPPERIIPDSCGIRSPWAKLRSVYRAFNLRLPKCSASSVLLAYLRMHSG